MLPTRFLRAAALALALLVPASLRAQGGSGHDAHHGAARDAAADSAAVVATVERFHAALAAGDSVGALALLSDRVIVLESGGVETRAEYRSHHLKGDIEFARAVKSVRGPMGAAVRGDAAWAWSTSTTQGEFRGRPVNSAGAELIVLERGTDGWRIAAVHWSSRRRS